MQSKYIYFTSLNSFVFVIQLIWTFQYVLINVLTPKSYMNIIHLYETNKFLFSPVKCTY